MLPETVTESLSTSTTSSISSGPHCISSTSVNPATGAVTTAIVVFLVAFFFAAVYWCFVVSFWLGGDPFKASLPVAAAWIAGVVLGIQGAGRASAGSSGMGFAVGALALLVAPWVLAIVGFFVVFLLGSAGVGPF